MRPSLLARVLIHPRETMRSVLDQVGTRGSVLIVIAACLSGTTKQVSARQAMDVLHTLRPAIVLLAAAVIVGAIALTVALYFGLSWLAMWSGRFVGGTGSYRDVRAAIAWGFVPAIWALVYRIPAMFLWPTALVRNHPGRADAIRLRAPAPPELYQIAIIAALEAIIWVWYFLVASNTLAEAQGISSWAGFANLLMAWVLPFVGGIVIALAAYLAF